SSPSRLGAGWVFCGEFAERASRPPNGIPMQRNTRTASAGNRLRISSFQFIGNRIANRLGDDIAGTYWVVKTRRLW
ncbi:MAG: hypothetical protein LH632_11425, partial [Rhodoferax sp.]|nr:hypothetical protein [Rhodoferax sp.]